ncbi:MAG: hypothetical protein IKW39_04405 [Alphaproteobacteria bacterium]|nr:hypothetical protein [Alphaproteobacteria bacterium]
MAFTPEQADYYHDRGMMPDWAWVQQNGRSPQWNYEYQKAKIYRELEEREAAKRREEAKKEIERQLLEAIVSTMEQGSEMVADAAADDIVASINAALNGTPAPASKKSFSVELGAMLGRALGQAPFKLLEEIFKDDEERRKR